MSNWDNEDYLSVIEMYAEEQGWIASEEELSERFDSFLEECCEPNKMTPTDIRCAFPDYVDMLCKDGEIHPEQANSYCYEGIYET